MARIRSIHPALFTDEAFVGVSMGARVLLLGLWTEADDQGVFDWKPITLKMRLMPVDNVDVPSLLLELEGANAILRFDQDGRSLGAIRNFCKFQRPKTPKYRPLKSAEVRNYVASAYPITEVDAPETIPFPQKVETTPQRKEEGGKRKEIEESIPPVARATRSANAKFDDFWKEYPKRDGENPRKPAEKKFNALVKTGVDPDSIIAGAKQASTEARARGNFGTRFIPQAIKWLNDQRFTDYAAASFEAQEPVAGYYAKADSEQLEAWDAHSRATRGKPLPRDSRCGWRVASEWPPGYVPVKKIHDPPPTPILRAMQ